MICWVVLVWRRFLEQDSIISFFIFQGFEVGECSIVAPFEGLGYGIPVGGAVFKFRNRGF
jgi:hypothetical protein